MCVSRKEKQMSFEKVRVFVVSNLTKKDDPTKKFTFFNQPVEKTTHLSFSFSQLPTK